jgi:polyisoprenoid-binding protein YceI
VSNRFSRRHILPLFAVPALAAGGVASLVGGRAVPAGAGATSATAQAAAQAATRAQAASSGAAVQAGATTSSAAPLVFGLVPGQSTATFRVREQLAGVSLPNDAVGTTTALSGQLALDPNGALVDEASKITVDLRELQTDSSRRDGFIKQSTLQTGRYPLAEFVPTGADGLPNPLPAFGEYTFALTGLLTVHGVQKEVTWQVTAARQEDRLTGNATTAFAFADFGMSPPNVPVVLSVVDEIRLEIDLVADLASQVQTIAG